MANRTVPSAARRVDEILNARLRRIRTLAVTAATAVEDRQALLRQAEAKTSEADAAMLELLDLVQSRAEVAAMVGIADTDVPRRPRGKPAAASIAGDITATRTETGPGQNGVTTQGAGER